MKKQTNSGVGSNANKQTSFSTNKQSYKRKENIMRLVQAIERMGALLGLPKHLTWRAEQDGRWWLTLSC